MVMTIPLKKKLMNRARKVSTWRKHDLKRFKPLGDHSWSSTCKNCNMEAVIDINPAPNGIDISGEAVALNCRAK